MICTNCKQNLPFDVVVVAITFAFLDYCPPIQMAVGYLQSADDAPGAVEYLVMMMRYCFACYCAADSPNGVLKINKWAKICQPNVSGSPIVEWIVS